MLMIKQGLILLMLIFILSSQSNAQFNVLYIVVNEATWCKYCKANGARIHELIDEYALNTHIVVINNDVTDEESKKKTIPALKDLGVYDYMVKHKESAVVFVFDAKTKKIMDKFSIKLTNEKILTHLNDVLERVTDS